MHSEKILPKTTKPFLEIESVKLLYVFPFRENPLNVKNKPSFVKGKSFLKQKFVFDGFGPS